MTDKWQPGKTYPPGSLVIPASQPAVDATSAQNGDFSAGDTGWDYTGSCAYSATGGYSNANCCIAPGSTTGGLALNKAKFLMSPGETISANCMIQQGASDVDHTRGYVQVYFYNASDAQIGDPISGNIVNDGRNGAWHQSSLATPAAAPAGTAYARCGIYLYQNSADPIWGDNLVVYYARRKPQAGLIFKATQTDPGKSAQTEPVWPTTTGVPVTDNEVTWEGVIATRLIWQASPILKSGATEPTWPLQVGGAVRDGTIDWIAVSRRIEDPNCPNSKVVAIMASKVFAADGDIVRFSATVNPLDWSSSQNAGYLPTGLQQANGNDMAVLAPYRSNLTAFNPSSFQNWQVDPDPASMALLDQMDGIGSSYQHAAQAVGNDLYYLSQLGVRTVSIAAGTDNLNAGDVGMPIDVLVQDAMRVAAANGSKVLATYYPSAGQYWLTMSSYPPEPLSAAGVLPQGVVNEAADFTYDISGGINPRVVSIQSGTLPTGLSMDSAGHITGTFSDYGTFSWVVQVEDAIGTIATVAQTMTVFAKIIADINFDTGSLTYDKTGRTWTVDSGTIYDRWGGQPVTVPVVVASPSVSGNAMLKTPDTNVHDGTFDYYGEENLGIKSTFGTDAIGPNVDFCIELDVRVNQYRESSSLSRSFMCFVTTNGRMTFGSRSMVMENTVVPAVITRTLWTPPSLVNGEYFHFAALRKGDVLSCWKGPTANSMVKYAEYIGAGALDLSSANQIFVGNGQGSIGSTVGWPGQFDNIKVTRGWARYT